MCQWQSVLSVCTDSLWSPNVLKSYFKGALSHICVCCAGQYNSHSEPILTPGGVDPAIHKEINLLIYSNSIINGKITQGLEKHFLIVKTNFNFCNFLDCRVMCETAKDASTTFKYVRLVHVYIGSDGKVGQWNAKIMFCVKGPLEYRYDWTFYIICTYIIYKKVFQNYYSYTKVFLYY